LTISLLRGVVVVETFMAAVVVLADSAPAPDCQ
jgi:hypothetical protein